MNILITFLNARRNAFGGIEKSIFSFIDGFFERNEDEIYVYTAKNGQNEKNFMYSNYLKINLNIPVDQIDETILKHYEEYNNEIAEEIISIIDKKKIEYILVVDQLWGILPHIKFRTNIKCRVGIIYHMYFEFQKDIIENTFHLNYDNYFAVSNDVREKIYLNCVNVPPIIILPNAYNPKEFYNMGLKKKNYIFCNSRLVKEKGIFDIIKALQIIHSKNQKIHLVLCGDQFCFGSNKEILRYIQKLKVDNQDLNNYIHILNNINWNQIPYIINQAQIVVLPTQYESFGIAALEAMACGIPLITTSVGNLPDLVGDAGKVVGYGEPKNLAQCIISILENRELRGEMMEKEIKKAKKYVNKNIINYFIKIARYNAV